MNESIYGQRAAAFCRFLTPSGENGCDGAWIINPENRRYLSGFSPEDSQFTESSGSLLINGANRLLITDSRYTLAAENEAAGFEVYTLKKNFVEDIPNIIKNLGLQNLGFEEEYVTWELHRKIARKLSALSPPVALTPLNGPVEAMREIKEDWEIQALEKSADMISEILDQIISALKPGLTEKEVAWQIENLAREAGADGLSFPSIVASGPNSALPHAVPSNRKIMPREPIILDAGVRLNGYCSDITRTVFLGDPDDDIKTIYRIVRQAQLEAIQQIRPSVKSDRVDSIARNIIIDAGLVNISDTACATGLALPPMKGPDSGRGTLWN